MIIKKLSLLVLLCGIIQVVFVGCSSVGELKPIDIPMYYEGNSPALGYQSAPITIVVYSDFSCGACREQALVLREVLTLYPDSVKLVFKHYPLIQHEQAMPAAQAAQAASFQGRFWDMHDMIFNHQNELTYELYVKLAQDVGLNAILFAEDLIKPATAMLIKQDIASGNKIGVQGTPTMIVNGNVVLHGIQSEEAIGRVIEQELMRQSIMKPPSSMP